MTSRERDTFDLFSKNPRGRFGDGDYSNDNQVVKSNLVDLDLILHNDNPNKKAIAVSLAGNTPFERWVWLARSLIEYERIATRNDKAVIVRVTLPERVAKEKGLV